MKKTYYCPHCNNLLHYREKNVVIASPFVKCPRCKNEVVDTACKEWFSLNIFFKIWGILFMMLKAIIGSMLVAGFIVVAFPSADESVMAIGMFISLIGILAYQIYSLTKAIKKSKERAKSKIYLDKLIKYDFYVPKRIYRKAE